MSKINVKITIDDKGNSFELNHKEATTSQITYALAALELCKVDLIKLFEEKEQVSFVDKY